MVSRNFDAYMDGSEPAYNVSKVCPADEDLSKLFAEEMEAEYPMVCTGINVTADSFYASQGRTDRANFDDRNDSLVDDICAAHPTASSCEMETFLLFHLAHCSREGAAKIRAASAAIIVANRHTSDVASGEVITDAERKGGVAALKALVRLPL
mmetsp:Transcript_12712/g.38130  ORF Transcript_12712/g.38130 Transcript_12712/m.38130 type:complete len:153 (-) Transcript_12712:212-670(-)